MPPTISIQDPVHGTIELTPAEIKLIDARPSQRLRYIRQLGFADMAFPGATHSRYAHCLGAMHVASRMADRILGQLALPAAEQARWRQAVRLAVLFHDLGHAPMSHVSERVMPQVARLGIDAWLADAQAPRQAHHEDYTVKLLLDSELAPLIVRHVGDAGVTPEILAALVTGRRGPLPADTFTGGGVDLLPLLSQIVSSELDADRMDYLRRDAYYTGVSYGHFDHLWLTQNLTAVPHDGRLVLALQHKAVWAFENFLLARFHMFLAVYYHHTAVCFDHLLGRFYASGDYTLPADVEAYLDTDDVQLTSALRASSDPWARCVVRRRPYRLLVETHEFRADAAADPAADAALDARLTAAGVDFFRVRSRGVLSKYFRRRDADPPLFIVEAERKRLRRVEEYTPLYRRFDDVVGIARVYCRPDQVVQARACLST